MSILMPRIPKPFWPRPGGHMVIKGSSEGGNLELIVILIITSRFEWSIQMVNNDYCLQ